MIVTTSFENAPARDVGVTGQVYRLWEFVGRAPVRGTYVEGNEANDNALPQGFLVQQPPGSVTRPHFHETNQFQVFVGGGGHFGKRPAAPLTVQYASGHTPYGPISANDEGLLYYTLRQRWDPGAKYMPAMRDRLVRGRQRQHLVPVDSTLLQSTGTHTLIAPHEDGLAASLSVVEPNTSLTLDSLDEGGGQYHIVVGGMMRFEGEAYGLHACQFADPDCAPYSVQAGADGLSLLVLRFPFLK